ncbi:Ecm22p KNAG_0A02550 [Huiozyma naganishii CBS 8797]|uniref:Zn(2)-C6 fungal-type domain-containing protein n=1 Tax=Huiozyma naganishii (strain ATCC MYA-139 / BCRC 22969 / CBS 8797 / KCTC 17520 / NBRC 10181 / NCYC 3082 / Yp74L-3) TaxID=1071383 RepID=J7S227_HUIN7|nr:hypothetical protein KNAG_0A02550 [Kazachstania naganishii CBS 8797]CCK67944.1 hypothetical protein KNAG_0A02550 [Kazachstania naganishii CBS 8797]
MMFDSAELVDEHGKRVSKNSTGKRKFHNKSKNGCDNCKRRRVKCDEGKPFCQKCANMRLECVFTPPQPRRKKSKVSNTLKRDCEPSVAATTATTTIKVHDSESLENEPPEMAAQTPKPDIAAAENKIADNLRRLQQYQQLQQLQQQHAQLFSQINSSLGNNPATTAGISQHFFSLLGNPQSSTLNSTPASGTVNSTENFLLPPSFTNTPSGFTSMGSTDSANTAPLPTSNSNLQTLGMNTSNGMSNMASPTKLPSFNASNNTAFNSNKFNLKSLNLIPNLLSSNMSSLAAGLNMPLDLQDILGGMRGMVPNGASLPNGKSSRSAKANSAEEALANMQQQQEERVKNSEKNALAHDSDKFMIPMMKSELDAAADDTSSQQTPTHNASGVNSSISESPLGSASTTSTTNETIPRLVELSSQAKINLIDLKLFHHYCSVVWPTIIEAGISGPDVWKTYIPELAFDYPFLMHTILAFAATHLSRTEPGLESYVSSHRLEALKLLREAVLEISDENTDALVASSLILIMDSLANASNTGPDSATTSPGDVNASAWIFHVKGAVTILTAVWPLPETSRFSNLISLDLSDLSNVLSQENRTVSELVCFDESISDLYPVEIDSPYLITLAYLDQLHREKNQLDFLLRIFAFPALLDRTFLALLMTGDLGAMRIMRSYYKMLMGFTTEVKDKVWFLEGVSQVLPQDVDEYSGGGGMHMMLDFLGGGLPSMTTTNLSEFM